MNEVYDANLLVQPTSVTVGEILKDNRFVIPDYQRDFSWKTKETFSLWEDLVSIAQSNIIPGPTQSKHFLGPVVLIEKASGEQEIVDGQQRLTFINILLICLSDYASKFDQETGKDLKGFLSGIVKENVNGDVKPKIVTESPTQKTLLPSLIFHIDRDSRSDYLNTQSKSSKVVEGRIANAARNCYEWVDSYLNEHSRNRAAAFKALVDAVTRHFILIRIQVKDTSKAFEVFERLNARGMPLGQADLVKNLFLNAASQQNCLKAVTDDWNTFIKYATESSQSNWMTPHDFLQIIYLSKYGWKFGQQDLAGSDLLSPYRYLLNGAPKIPVKQLSQILVKEAKNLNALLTCPNTFSKDLQNFAGMLRINLSNRFSFIAALAIMSVYKTDADRIKGVRFVHSLVMRSFVVGETQIASYMRISSEMAVRIRNEKVSLDSLNTVGFSNLDQFGSAIESKFSSQKFMDDLKNYIPSNAKIGFYIAYMLEVAAAAAKSINAFGGAHPDLQSAKQHLEHIMPQSVAKAPAWSHLGIKADEAPRIFSRWGNLLVLPSKVNTSLKAKGISEKVAVYNGPKCSALELPRKIQGFCSEVKPGHTLLWNETEILLREKHLIDNYSLSAWPSL